MPSAALARDRDDDRERANSLDEADHVHFRRCTIARPITQSLSLSLRELLREMADALGQEGSDALKCNTARLGVITSQPVLGGLHHQSSSGSRSPSRRFPNI
jgi:hypothetical protein